MLVSYQALLQTGRREEAVVASLAVFTYRVPPRCDYCGQPGRRVRAEDLFVHWDCAPVVMRAVRRYWGVSRDWHAAE